MDAIAPESCARISNVPRETVWVGASRFKDAAIGLISAARWPITDRMVNKCVGNVICVQMFTFNMALHSTVTLLHLKLWPSKEEWCDGLVRAIFPPHEPHDVPVRAILPHPALSRWARGIIVRWRETANDNSGSRFNPRCSSGNSHPPSLRYGTAGPALTRSRPLSRLLRNLWLCHIIFAVSQTAQISRRARGIVGRWFDPADDHFGSGVRCATFSGKSHPCLPKEPAFAQKATEGLVLRLREGQSHPELLLVPTRRGELSPDVSH
jgi:hypothetical protein